MKKTLLTLFALFLFSLTSESQAQQDTTRTRVIIREPGRSLVKKEPTKGFVVKTSLYRWLRGELPLLIEFPVSKNVHIEFGPTLTYYDIGCFIWLQGVVFEKHEKVGRYDEPIMSYNGARLGYGFSAQVKYFFEKDDLFSGSGIGLYANNRTHLYDFEINNAIFNPGMIRVQEYALMFIRQEHDYGVKEFNFGLGVITHKMDYAKYDDTSGTVIYSPATVRLLKPAIFYNLKFGLAKLKK